MTWLAQVPMLIASARQFNRKGERQPCDVLVRVPAWENGRRTPPVAKQDFSPACPGEVHRAEALCRGVAPNRRRVAGTSIHW